MARSPPGPRHMTSGSPSRSACTGLPARSAANAPGCQQARSARRSANTPGRGEWRALTAAAARSAEEGVIADDNAPVRWPAVRRCRPPTPAGRMRSASPCSMPVLRQNRLCAPMRSAMLICVRRDDHQQDCELMALPLSLPIAVFGSGLMAGDGLPNGPPRGLLGPAAAHPNPAAALRQLLARPRRALGRAPDGREWIEHRGHGVYALHPEARVDCLEFEALTGAGARAADPAPLAEALNLVRGQPFTSCYYWWLEPAIVEAVTALLLMTSRTLPHLPLRASDPAAAPRPA